MKKPVTVAVVMGTVCFQDLIAQSCGPVTIAIGERFKKEFNGATHVRWIKIKDMFQARFYHNREYRLAFFDASGELLMSGRKIPLNLVPAVVGKEIERIREETEADRDVLFVAGIYELNYVQDTRYFINLESEGLSMSIVVDSNGRSAAIKKINSQSSESLNSLLASHYPGACG